MSDRPILNTNLDAHEFREYYYLKEELVEFCRKHNLPTGGGKLEITDRIAHFLECGDVLEAKSAERKTKTITQIQADTLIETDFVCSEKHRAFFKEQIGKGFSFNVTFQKWLKNNAGKTYQDAIEAYAIILKEKKTKKTVIDKQFEYNTYIRDFFADNKGKTLEDAIRCWKYKKQLQGHNRYERMDLVAIEK